MAVRLQFFNAQLFGTSQTPEAQPEPETGVPPMYVKTRSTLPPTLELASLYAIAARQTFLEDGEEKTLAHDLHHGSAAKKQRARERLVLSHIRFAVNISREGFRNSPVPADELAQQAIIGLLLATKKYDGRVKFATYATQWVYQTIKEYAIRFQGIVHVPSSADRKRKKIRSAAAKAKAEGVFSVDVLADQLGMRANEVCTFLSLGSEVSLNIPVGEDGETERLDLLADPHEVDPLADKLTEQRNSLLHRALALLDEREREIVLARKGVGRDEEETLEILAQRFEISRERVRQIEQRAYEKLASCEFAAELREFLY
jgi:RNA polymerase sigma-32 factor